MSDTPTKDMTNEEFEAEQDKLRKEQNLGPNAVPERRPQASQQDNGDMDSDLTKRQKADGKFDPMPKEAYEKAEKEPTKASLKKEKVASIRPGEKVRVIDKDHEHYGSAGAVLSVKYDGPNEQAKAQCGDPAVANYAKVATIQIRTRGASADLVSLKPDQVKIIDKLGIDSSDE